MRYHHSPSERTSTGDSFFSRVMSSSGRIQLSSASLGSVACAVTVSSMAATRTRRTHLSQPTLRFLRAVVFPGVLLTVRWASPAHAAPAARARLLRGEDGQGHTATASAIKRVWKARHRGRRGRGLARGAGRRGLAPRCRATIYIALEVNAESMLRDEAP